MSCNSPLLQSRVSLKPYKKNFTCCYISVLISPSVSTMSSIHAYLLKQYAKNYFLMRFLPRPYDLDFRLIFQAFPCFIVVLLSFKSFESIQPINSPIFGGKLFFLNSNAPSGGPTHLKRYQRLQNRAIKTIFGKKRCDHTPTVQLTKISSIEDRSNLRFFQLCDRINNLLHPILKNFSITK